MPLPYKVGETTNCFEEIVFKNLVDDTNCENCGFQKIPVDKIGNVDEKYFKKYILKKGNKND